ncbi:MAG: hypothetical protein V1709_10320 [Planctomycetota bacterium]
MWNKAIEKLLSGRYILTVASALVFVYCSIKGILKPDTVATIVVMVFTLYFSRDRNGIPKP